MTQLDGARANFLAELSARHPSFLVWKHLDRAVRGVGDVDAAAPATDAPRIVDDAASLARSLLGAAAVIRCDHVADKRLTFFVLPRLLPQLFELDVCVGPSRGLTPWADPARMAKLAILDDRGIRRLRPGAEALVSLVYHGLSYHGGRRLSGDEEEIVTSGLRRDRDGAHYACSLLAPLPARRPLHRLLEMVEAGVWVPSLSRHAFWGFVVSGAAHPAFTGRRIAFRSRIAARRDCVMHRVAQAHGRRVEEHRVPALLAAARQDGHNVVLM